MYNKYCIVLCLFNLIEIRFLFWTTKFGLYRLDLSKKVKNLKTEMSRIIYHKDIGPFVIDYINFCLMVLFPKNNTIMSVSFDG